jgi:hypothetical protein
MHQNWWGHGTPSLKSCEAQIPNVETEKSQLHTPHKMHAQNRGYSLDSLNMTYSHSDLEIRKLKFT